MNRLRLAVGVALAFLFAACGEERLPAIGGEDVSLSSGGTGGSGAMGGAGAAGGSGGRAPPECAIDADCPAGGLRCDDDPGSSTFGELCKVTLNCGATEGFDYCRAVSDCTCVDDPAVGEPFKGVCHRRLPTCAPCRSDAACGDHPVAFDSPAVCRPFVLGSDTADVCLPLLQGGCPRGMMPADDSALAGTCVPSSGDCADFDPPVVIEEPWCRFEYETGISHGCPQGEVCHEMIEGLDPALLDECSTASFFGQGMCGDPCASDADCARFSPAICATEPGGAKRCRPPRADEPGVAACLHDSECRSTAADGHVGFCELDADPTGNRCVADACRIGPDPRTGCDPSDHVDCAEGFRCEPDPKRPGYGSCIE